MQIESLPVHGLMVNAKESIRMFVTESYVVRSANDYEQDGWTVIARNKRWGFNVKMKNADEAKLLANTMFLLISNGDLYGAEQVLKSALPAGATFNFWNGRKTQV